jgi:hypothetical protein
MSKIAVLRELATINKHLPAFVKEQARIFGLGIINYDKPVSINKMSEININPNGMPNRCSVMNNGYIQIIGNEDGLIWLYAQSGFTWFKTSPIVDVTRLADEDGGMVLEIETENSIYHLHQRLN